MKAPEILFDAPSRVERGRPVPLFLFIKDADRFPVVLDTVFIRFSYDSGIMRELTFPYGGLTIRDPFWWDSFNIVPEQDGIIHILPCAAIKIGKKNFQVIVDNYRGATGSPLVITCSPDSYPTVPGWYHGDIHCHSYYTSDQIEFGAPVEASALAGFASGLDWIALADHSYDLDDMIDNYLAEDPSLNKWRIMQRAADLLDDTFTVIPGEEVTCRNRVGRNCHMLALDARRFIRGSGDGGEKGLNTLTEHSIAEAAALCLEWGGLPIAAHPFEHVPFTEKLILNRGEWSDDDILSSGISLLQIHNGVRDRGFLSGLDTWRRFLKEGRRVVICGGSDSHGDFNRRRAIGFPLLTVEENLDHIFASVRTVVRASSRTRDDIISAIRGGKSQVTEGPFIDLSVSDGDNFAFPGDTLMADRFEVRADFLSNKDFGTLKETRILAGDERGERIISVMKISDDRYGISLSSQIDGRIRYVRASCETKIGKLCLTNPVWTA